MPPTNLMTSIFAVVSLTVTAQEASQNPENWASHKLEQRFSVGGGVGEVAVRYTPTAKAETRYSNGKLTFYRHPFVAPFQSNDTFVLMPAPQIDILDVNGDGYNDVIFYNQFAGYGGAPTRGAHVFMYIPNIKKFVKSATLSDRGEIQPTKSRGCVLVTYKSGVTGYTAEKWCFNVKRGVWRMMQSEGGEAEGK
jgi:hypothetical protein